MGMWVYSLGESKRSREHPSCTARCNAWELSREGAALTEGPGPSAPPSLDPEIAALAADAMAPYLHRSDLTPDAWREFGRRVTSLPEDKRDAVLRQVFGAITRQELLPPAGISFAEVF